MTWKQMKKPAKIRHANFYSITLLAMCFDDTVTTIDTEFEMWLAKWYSITEKQYKYYRK